MCYSQWFINIICLFFALICTAAVLPNNVSNFSTLIAVGVITVVLSAWFLLFRKLMDIGMK